MILSLQLPFAVVPLVMFTAEKRRWAPSPRRAWLTAIAAITAAIIIVLNLKLIYDVATGGYDVFERRGYRFA